MRGITPVIAVILLLLITISIVGFSYVWFSGILQTVAETTENTTQSELIRMNQKILIENAIDGAITIRNIGTQNIPSTALALYLNNVLNSSCNWSANVAPGAIDTAACGCETGDTVKVTAPGNSDIDFCQ